MKSSFLMITIIVLLVSLVSAQNSIPQAMRYQAIARDSDGIIKSEESIIAKVELMAIGATEQVIYAELHNVTSSPFGLINMSIGEGIATVGSFSEVPWNEHNLWVRVSTKKEENEDYQIITTSKFYTVPYAFYAASAGQLADDTGLDDPGVHIKKTSRDDSPKGMNSINWNLTGNRDAQNWNDGDPVLGTVDDNPLVLVTNCIPRMIISESGDINYTGDVDFDGDLNVDGNVHLNSLGGTTIIHGPTTVANMSPTHLTGTLQVDKSTTLEDTLTVENMAPTHLTGPLDVDKTLNVDEATTLNDSLDVANMSPTHLTGTLQVDKSTALKDMLTVENMAPTHLTGSLYVDKTLNVDGTTTLNDSLDVTGMSPTHLTGTLLVDKLTSLKAGLSLSGTGTLGPNGDHLAFFDNTEGGNSDGIGIRIQKNETTAENNFVTFYRGDDGVAGRIEGYVLNDIGIPPLPTSDEIWTAICIAIADYNPVTLFWTQFALQFNLFGTIWNGATIPAFEIPDFEGWDLPTFPGLDLPTFPGLGIPDIPSVSIEGVGTIFPGLNLPDIPSFNIPDIPSFNIPDVPPFEIPDVPEIDLSTDLFEVPTIPTFSDILMDLEVCPNEGIFDIPGGYVYRLIEWGVQNDMQSMISFDPIDLAAKALTWAVTKVVKVGGVTYGAKGADYAEYLPKLHPEETFIRGELVGVYGGRISKNTVKADQVLAISTNPVVLGNLPEDSIRGGYEKVGFLGQVPVFVTGPVEIGDYIVPSGKNDGMGRSIKPDELTAENLPQILGKAWSSSPLNNIAVINVSIGLRPTEIGEVLKKRERSLIQLQQQIDIQRETHEKLQGEIDLLKVHLGLESYSSNQRSN